MKHFEKFTFKQVKALSRHLKEHNRFHSPETLHQIRIDIKKIKAILSVIGNSVKGFHTHKNFIPFREIFRRVSDIREPDVLNKLLLQYHKEGTVKNRRTVHSRSLVKAFDSDTSHFINTVKNRGVELEHFSKKVHPHDLSRYLDRKKLEVKPQLYPKPQMRVIHKTRKAIKEIIYLSQIQGKLKNNEAAFYNNLQHQIGQLHDKQVLSGLLKNKRDKTSLAKRALISAACVSDKKEISRLVRDYFG